MQQYLLRYPNRHGITTETYNPDEMDTILTHVRFHLEHPAGGKVEVERVVTAEREETPRKVFTGDAHVYASLEELEAVSD